MPYRPTNMSPDNVAIVRGQDIIFHCLIDKYDRIDRVKLTLYDTNNEENNAYIVFEEGIMTDSKQLLMDEENSSKLPFIASDYDIPIFAIGIKSTSEFFNKNSEIIASQISYILELSGANVYENFVLEGNILKVAADSPTETVDLYLPPSPLINSENQQIVNPQGKSYPFEEKNDYYYQQNKIEQVDITNKLITLQYPIKEEGFNKGLKLETAIGIFSIDYGTDSATNLTTRQLKIKEKLPENLEDFLGTMVTIYNEFNVIQTQLSFINNYQVEKILAEDSLINPLPDNIEIQIKTCGSKGNSEWFVVGLYGSHKLTEEDIQKINLYNYYCRQIDTRSNLLNSYIKLGSVIKGEDFYNKNIKNIGDTDKWSQASCDYCFSRMISSWSEYDGMESELIYIENLKIEPDLLNKNSYFQIKSNSVASPERTFTLIDEETVSITEELNALTTQIYSGSLTGEQNTIEYSQWSLSDANGVVIDETPRAYAKIENYQYNFFKPNSTYKLKLKVHDKRNIDWKAEKEITTGNMPYNQTYNEATLDEKAIKISLPTGTKATSYIINRLEMKPKNNSVNNDSFWLKEYITESTQDYDIINKITLKEVGSLCSSVKDYSAGQGKYYRYEIIPIGIENPVIYRTNIVDTFDWYEINLFGTKSYYKNTDKHRYEVDENNLWTFELDAVANQITFNATNTPIDASGSQYPKITGSHKNYLSGSGSMYLGTLDENNFYSRDNDAELMRFYKFANNGAVKFLKLKNGMVIPVSITLKNGNNLDNLIGNPTKINFDWVQVDDINSSLTKEEIKIPSTDNSSSNEDEPSEEVSV